MAERKGCDSFCGLIDGVKKSLHQTLIFLLCAECGYGCNVVEREGTEVNG